MPDLITCSNCQKSFFMRPEYVKKNMQKYGVYNKDNLELVYLCSKCRPPKLKKKRKKGINPKALIPYVSDILDLQTQIQEQVNIYIERGLNNLLARNNFLECVKLLLAKVGVTQYSYIIKDDKLKGIQLLNIPIFNEITIKLKS